MVTCRYEPVTSYGESRTTTSSDESRTTTQCDESRPNTGYPRTHRKKTHTRYSLTHQGCRNLVGKLLRLVQPPLRRTRDSY